MAGDAPYEGLLASGHARVLAEPDERDIATLMYTGGTTGPPKAAMLSHRAHVLNAYHVDRALDFGGHRRHLHQVPMFHAAAMGQLLALPSNGACSVVLDQFDPVAVLDAIRTRCVDQTVMVPTSIAMLLDHERFDSEHLASLSGLIYGAAPMPAALLTRVRDVLPWVHLHQGYGMTESTQAVSVLNDADHRRDVPHRQSAGRPVMGVELEIRDETRAPVDTGVVGEIWARGGNFLSGYWQRPDETAAALVDGWFRTGDVGRLDDRGYLYVLDRSKDMIKSGGENVYSIEVENALASHPAVSTAAVIGIPDDTWGERVHAVVVAAPGEAPTAAELQAHARQRLAAYKIPRTFEIGLQPLPLSGAGKVLKRELRKRAIAARTESPSSVEEVSIA